MSAVHADLSVNRCEGAELRSAVLPIRRTGIPAVSINTTAIFSITHISEVFNKNTIMLYILPLL